MTLKICLSELLISVFLCAYCVNSSNSSISASDKKQIQKQDSLELTNLVRKVYEWHETEFRTNGFSYLYESPGDSIITGVDWEKFEKDMGMLRKTNFFSKEFISEFKRKGLSVDSSIKQSAAEWRNMNDGIQIWDAEADAWCSCQDSPDEYWKTLTLNDFTLDKDTLSFYWTWGNKEEQQYKMRAVRDSGVWKISFMQGFNFYHTVKEYEKIKGQS